VEDGGTQQHENDGEEGAYRTHDDASWSGATQRWLRFQYAVVRRAVKRAQAAIGGGSS
jgi:hypothetical protein